MSVTPIRTADEVSSPRSGVGLGAGILLLLDPLLILAALGLVACSLITLKGVTRGHSLMVHQAIFAGIGITAAIVLTRIDYSYLRRFRYPLYAATILLNLVVYGMPAVQGAHRWVPLPLIQFQSSEFGKILLILSLSAFVVDLSRRLDGARTTLRIMLLALLPAMIVIPQPDLGTGLVYLAAAFTILIFAGTPWKHLLALVALGVVAMVGVLALAPAAGVHVLKPYQVQRLTGFLHPSHDPRNQTYQITESLIAIGSGGKTGTGAAHATQTTLNFLPEEQTDFIFAVVGETYGFMGAALVLSLYALLIWRTLRILTMAKNLFGTLIAGGVLAMLMFQVFVNVGMTVGIMPITGVPLPLLSYGGSSVLVTFMALGLLQSIHVQARLASGSKKGPLLI